MKIKDAKWQMTDDEIGMKPKFRVWCRDCFWDSFEKKLMRELAEDIYRPYVDVFRDIIHKMLEGAFDLHLRETFCSPLPTIGDRAFHNDMHYKCCGEGL